jgi:hypothetical protein
MKLQMLFLLMDIFTLTIIPFVFVLEKLRQLRKNLTWSRKQKAV